MFRATTRTRIHWIAPCRPRFAIAPSRHATPSLIRTRTASSTSTTVIQPAIKGRSKQDIMKFLYGHQQRPVPGGKPNTILTHCPHCLYVRKSSFAASVNIESGTYSCKTCHSSGSWQQFTKALRKKLAHNNRPDYIIHGSSDLFSNTRPAFEHSIEKVAAFPSQLSDSALTTVAERYHLRPEVMRMYQVGLGEYKGTACLTFPQTVLVYGQEDDAFQVETMRIKACGLEDDALITYDPPTATHHTTGLFGYHTIPSDADTIILTRREVDAMAAYQATGVPSVSLPTSDYYQLHESVLPLLERFSKIYVWMDKDMDGQMASERFASKLGDARCLLINNQPLPHDALVQGDDLTEMLQSAQSIKHDEIMDFTDLRDLVQKEVLYPEQTQGVQSTDLPSLNAILKGHRPGELTILTGPTGAGKTTIISQISLDYCKSGVPTLWGSFEIVNRRLAKKMLYQYAGKDISKSPEEFDHWASEFQQVRISKQKDTKLDNSCSLFTASTLLFKVLQQHSSSRCIGCLSTCSLRL